MSLFLYIPILFITVFLLIGCTSQRDVIIPKPLSVKMEKGSFKISSKSQIKWNVPSDDRRILEEYMRTTFLKEIVNNSKEESDNLIFIVIDAKNEKIHSKEGYELVIKPDRIVLKALSGAGLFYGIQTLSQLMDRNRIPVTTIYDEPRFSYRGVMIDVSRHFFSKEFIKKQIDILSYYKLNRLHLHLTDAAGWRVEIKRYPKLTQMGAFRTYSNWKQWWTGGRKYMLEGEPGAHGGFYTQDDIREIVDYARKHYITVIPEIEMPSHSEEVLTAYPELSCTHEPYKQADFCVGNEKTFEFLQNVLTEIIELFPSQYIHIGGDEASKASWKDCPLCRKRMKDQGMKDVNELQSYLIHRIELFLNSKGRSMIGWDEILEGGLAPNATVMSWRGEDGGIKAIRRGNKAIMTPGEFCYFDSYQDAPDTQPEAIGGYLPWSKVYSYEPVPDSLTTEEMNLVYGVQANLWTEYISTPSHVEYMLYPRALALAEVAWTMPKYKSEVDFRYRLLHAVEMMKNKGYNLFELKKEKGNRKEAKRKISHLALGKKAIYNAPYYPQYTAGGDSALTDGVCGGWTYLDKRWQGFITRDRMDVIIDMERSVPIHNISATFMQVCGPEVFLPAKIIISVSDDNKNYVELKCMNHRVVKNDQVQFIPFGWKGKAKARYIRYQALAGEFGGFIFTDEVVVR